MELSRARISQHHHYHRYHEEESSISQARTATWRLHLRWLARARLVVAEPAKVLAR